MVYETKNMGAYDLHLIKTDKFKTISISIIFNNEVNKEKITQINFLSNMLTSSSKKYNTIQKLAFRKQDLYSLKIETNCYRAGRDYISEINTIMLDPRYSEKNMLEKTISFLGELILNPNIKKEKFDKTTFDLVYRDELTKMNTVYEDKKKYSLVKLLENLGKDTHLEYSEFGYKEDLEKITRENLCDFYKQFLKESKIDIIILGNIDFNKTIEVFKEKFNLNINKKIDKKELTYIPKRHNNLLKLYEEGKTEQGKLSVGCIIDKKMTIFEREYVLYILNTILGGNPNSKLFTRIREENSLCYYVNSLPNKLDNLLFIVAGINKEDYDKVLFLINEEIESIKNGNINDYEIRSAKIEYEFNIEDSLEKPFRIITSFYSSVIYDSDLIDERIEKIRNVTKKDVIELAKHIHIDTTYLLGGINDGN